MFDCIKKIYVVMYNYFYYNDVSSHPLKAFTSEEAASQFIVDCIKEGVKKKETYEAYEKNTAEEVNKLKDKIRLTVYEKHHCNIPEQKRMLEITQHKLALVNSHRFHPNSPAFERPGDEIEYHIEVLNLVQ